MPGPVFAEGDTVTLRTIEEADLDFLQRGRNHPEVRRPLTDADPRNGEQIREYFENSVSNDDGFGFLICTEAEDGDDDPTPVGTVHVPWIRSREGVGMLMYWVLPEHQGNGYVTEATELTLDYAFEERRLAKVFAHVLVPNEASWHVLEKLGFQREGRQRKESFVDGERVDSYRYGLLAEEWLETSGP
jgi:RimJ/RimL family protein N-acetyltransferase